MFELEMKGANFAAAISVVIATALLAAAPGAATAAVTVPGIGYDLDAGPGPMPAALGELDLHLPDGAGPGDDRPVVVYVHGGGWHRGDKGNKIGDKARLFTGAGYVFASVNYRLSPDPIDPAYPADRVRFPDHPEDVGEAIGWLDRNVADYGGDPTRIILIGHSAGAQIVSLLATDPRYVKDRGVERRHLIGAIALDGEYDIAHKATTGSRRSRTTVYNAFATAAENAVDRTWSKASPIEWADGADPRLLVITQQRAPWRAARAEAMVAALGPDASLLAVPYDHAGINAAVGAASDPAGETDAIMDFIGRAVQDSRTSGVRFRKHPPARVKLRRDRPRVKVRFRFVAEHAADHFECRFDAARFRRCKSPKSYRVGRGRHAFRVRAIAGNGEPGPVSTDRFRVLRR